MDHGDIVVEGTPRDLKRQVSGESVVLSIRDVDGAADRALAALGAQDFVREISLDGDEVRLYVEDASAALPHILRLLDGERIGVKSMQLSEPTLDDVFLRRTGRSLRDAGPGTDKVVAA
jgi:ABC-2 type transport system ATP-binding protein